jgi:glycolate oxidase FAD binding subunit
LNPTSEAELCATLQAIAASGVPIDCQGNGTKRHHGPAVATNASRVSVRALDAVVAYEPNDLVVAVQVGMRLGELQRRLAAHNQWLPIDPPYADATLGGIIASNSAGPRRLGYGTIKDYILGLRTANATGIVTKSGGRVVKNVTGYDLHRLHVGAFGTLGVLVEVNLKVVPRPDVIGVVVLGFSSLAQAHGRLLEIAASSLRPVALEAMDGVVAQALRRAVGGLPAGEALGLVGVEGTRPVFDRHLIDLNVATQPTSSCLVLEGSGAEALWAAMRDVRAGDGTDVDVDIALGDTVVVRVGTTPYALPALLDGLALPRAGALGTAVQVGTGLARVVFPTDDLTATTEILGLAQEMSARAGGYLIVESAPLGLPRRSRLPWSAGERPLDRTLRQAWDPERRLNPGRMPA